MKDLGIHSNRPIFYQEFVTTFDWAEKLPQSNWCAVILTEKDNRNYFGEIVSKIADRNVGYVVGIGRFGELVHDWADEEFVIRDVEPNKTPLPHHVMTIWEENLEEGLWDSLNLTSNPETEITKVVLIDVTGNENTFEQINNILQKFEKGYLPPEK